jgi:diphosphomevalonate decarboxylase
MKATARANSNIAFIKYWGNIDEALRLPANPSLSMNLDGLHTETTVHWLPDDRHDTLTINGALADDRAVRRVSQHLHALRARFGISHGARVESQNNFPMGAGIASSASSFAALTVAAAAAAHAELSERELTCLARLGSGSASRSVPSGFVEWQVGTTHDESFAFSLAPHHYWDLVDVVALVSADHKEIGSREGHTSAPTSEFQNVRVQTAAERLEMCRRALIERDFRALAEVVEHDSDMMHAVMMTSRPPLFYWLPGSLTVMDAIRRWRAEGLRVCYTLDAGPNVHCICVAEDADEIERRVTKLKGVQGSLRAQAGGGAVVIGAI